MRTLSESTELCIVYFGNDWFAENRTSSHHIARRLGARVPLLYVEMPGLRAPKASGRDMRKLLRKMTAAVKPPQQIGPHMWHISVPQIPFRRYALARKLNHWFGQFKVRQALRRLKLPNPISWFVVPHPEFLAGRLGERMVVYYCIDNYAALPDVNVEDVTRMDVALTRKANLVFAASPGLVEAKRKDNANVIFSPHGVDSELFGQAADRSRPVAEGAQGLARPVVGFFGVLDGRFDFELIEYLAKARPQWNFLLVGRVASDSARFSRFSNVHLPGAVPYATLPDWARAFDVCIMPYHQDAFSANANPLKLREYLATGRPVVSVPMPEVNRFAAHVSIARSPAEFLTAIEQQLAMDNEDLRRERMRLVSASTWDARVREVMEKVISELQKVSAAG